MIDKKRSLVADIAKGLGIILVVMDHHVFIHGHNPNTQIVILSFHMPLFYFRNVL